MIQFTQIYKKHGKHALHDNNANTVLMTFCSKHSTRTFAQMICNLKKRNKTIMYVTAVLKVEKLSFECLEIASFLFPGGQYLPRARVVSASCPLSRQVAAKTLRFFPHRHLPTPAVGERAGLPCLMGLLLGGVCQQARGPGGGNGEKMLSIRLEGAPAEQSRDAALETR